MLVKDLMDAKLSCHLVRLKNCFYVTGFVDGVYFNTYGHDLDKCKEFLSCVLFINIRR